MAMGRPQRARGSVGRGVELGSTVFVLQVVLLRLPRVMRTPPTSHGYRATSNRRKGEVVSVKALTLRLSLPRSPVPLKL
jgi:hypothetical protein